MTKTSRLFFFRNSSSGRDQCPLIDKSRLNRDASPATFESLPLRSSHQACETTDVAFHGRRRDSRPTWWRFPCTKDHRKDAPGVPPAELLASGSGLRLLLRLCLGVADQRRRIACVRDRPSRWRGADRRKTAWPDRRRRPPPAPG